MKKFLLLVTLVTVVQNYFGGEEPLADAPDPDKWHHEGITRLGSTSWLGAPGGDLAQNAIAFHSDYIDSYLYNPLWWFDPVNGGGPARLEVYLSTRSELEKLHFDDLFDNLAINRNWRRNLSGTVCGLLWLASSNLTEPDKISSAHNIIGASLHGIQDFYSHSNWIDTQARRDKTWFESTDNYRRRGELYTGYYELNQTGGVHPHGTYQLECALFAESIPRSIFHIVCHAASPASKTSVCRMFKRCKSSIPVTLPVRDRFKLPNGVVFSNPGMNLDSRWQAPDGVQTRGADMKPPISPDEAFETAYRLAVRSTCQWLNILEEVMNNSGLESFWKDVTTKGVSIENYKKDTAPFEKMHLLPYQFLTAGPYPPPHSDEEKWYVRLSIKTSDKTFANTNAKIVPLIDGVELDPLDHTIKPTGGLVDAMLGHNDFTAGSLAAYIVGPVDTPPTTLELQNRAPSTLKLIEKAAEDLWEAIQDAADWLLQFLLSLVGYHADFIAQDVVKIDANTLSTLEAGQSAFFSLDCDGDSEGHYVVTGNVMATNISGAAKNGVPTRRYIVTMSTLHCHEESAWDRGSSADEPFIIGVVISHGAGARTPWRSQFFEDVDTGDRREIGRQFDVDVAAKFGFITLPVAVYESDDETAAGRQELLDEFADTFENRTKAEEDSLGNSIGEYFGQSWHCEYVDFVAFRRGLDAELIEYQREPVDQWVSGGEGHGFPAVQVRSQRIPVPDHKVGASSRCAGLVYVPGPGHLRDGPNPDSVEDGRPYNEEMFDDD